MIIKKVVSAKMFFNLTQSLLVETLGKWCGVKDLVKVDSAVCNVHERPKYIKVIEFKAFVVPKCIMNGGMDSWMSLRKVKFLCLELDELNIQKLKDSALDLTKLETVSFRGFGISCNLTSNIIADSLHCSGGLKCLRGDEGALVSNGAMLKSLLNMLKTLKVLRLDLVSFTPYSPPTSYPVFELTELTTVQAKIACNFDFSSSAYFLNHVRLNAQLQIVHLNCSSIALGRYFNFFDVFLLHVSKCTGLTELIVDKNDYVFKSSAIATVV